MNGIYSLVLGLCNARLSDLRTFLSDGSVLQSGLRETHAGSR